MTSNKGEGIGHRRSPREPQAQPLSAPEEHAGSAGDEGHWPRVPGAGFAPFVLQALKSHFNSGLISQDRFKNS